MKLLRIIPLLSLAALLSACLGEAAYCPTDRNIILKLGLALEHGRLGDYMQNVDLFIFDANTGVLMYRQSAVVSGDYTLMSLNHLAPGTYRIVAWGNATPQQSSFGRANVGDHIDNAYVGRVGVPRSTSPQPGNGDRFFFAPGLAQNAFTITVPQSGNLTATLPFARAYIGIEVFVTGFNEHTGEAAAPIVEIDGASSHFCFDRVPAGYITLRETTVIQTQYVQRPAIAMFRTKLFDNNANFAKELRVHSGVGTNAVHFTLDNATLRQLVAQFMADNNITSLKADTAPRRTIQITINFGYDISASVEIREFERVPAPPVW